MGKFFEKVVEKKVLTVVVFILAALLCAVLTLMVDVNYDFKTYLPEGTNSTVGYDTMQEEFNIGVPNAKLMVYDMTIPEALELEEKIMTIEGVDDVWWLDDYSDVNSPIETNGYAAGFYKYDAQTGSGTALFQVIIAEDHLTDATDALRYVTDKEFALSGTGVVSAEAATVAMSEVTLAFAIIIPVVILIMMFCTRTWLDPVLMMLSIGVAIVINAGTNIFLGEISFVTNAASGILQLAVSMDYSIFLLHRFDEYRNQGYDTKEAMVLALKQSLTAILGSAITTIIGFAALIFMQFRIGPDMGIVMAKGIVISFITTMTFLPAISLLACKLNDKLRHKPLMPSFRHTANAIIKLRYVSVILFLAILVPALLAQNSNSFVYGGSQMFVEGTRVYDDNVKIESEFGQANQIVLLVPKNDSTGHSNIAREKELSDRLQAEVAEVTGVYSYVDTVSSVIPVDYAFAISDQVSQLISENYSRIILTVAIPTEGDEAFAVVEEIKGVAAQVYPDDTVYQVGETPITYDMKIVTVSDMQRVTVIVIVSVFLVILLTMRTAILPAILVLVIECAIWINLSIPYLSGNTMYYMAYLIISSVQLGATVDYAILLSTRYLEERFKRPGKEDKKDVLRDTLMNTIPSILTSALILFFGGGVLGIVSTFGVLKEMGILVARGAVLSTVLVLFALPAFLYILDGAIMKTTFRRGMKAKKPVPAGIAPDAAEASETENEKVPAPQRASAGSDKGFVGFVKPDIVTDKEESDAPQSFTVIHDNDKEEKDDEAIPPIEDEDDTEDKQSRINN